MTWVLDPVPHPGLNTSRHHNLPFDHRQWPRVEIHIITDMRIFVFIVFASLLMCSVLAINAGMRNFLPPSSVGRQSSSSLLAMKTKGSTLEDLKKKDNMIGYVLQNLDIMRRGLEDFVPSIQAGFKLRQRKAKQGALALSYEETKQLSVMYSDLMNMATKVFIFFASKEWFFYNNLLFPLMSQKNPWIWPQSFPSSFDDATFKARRENALQQRKFLALLSGVEQLEAGVSDDLPEKQRQDRAAQIDTIKKALLANKKGTLSEALSVLDSWLLVPKNSKNSKEIRLQNIPSKLVKEILRSVGTDGVPDWIIINQMNRGTLRKYFDGLAQSDTFLVQKGINNLSVNDVSFIHPNCIMLKLLSLQFCECFYRL